MLDEQQKQLAKESLRSVIFVLCCIVLLAPEILLFWFSCLREDQVFWTNAGGYPVGLRHTVLFGFYPLLALNLAGLLGLTFVFLATLRRPLCMVGLKLSAILICWGVFSGAMAISGANNLINFLEGKPIHGHPNRNNFPR